MDYNEVRRKKSIESTEGPFSTHRPLFLLVPGEPQRYPINVIKKIAFIALLVLPALLAGYLLGQTHGRRAACITEFKQYSGNMLNLTQWETHHPPELKDFIKAHYYRLANQIPEDWVGTPSNYGPVSTNISLLTVFKGPSKRTVGISGIPPPLPQRTTQMSSVRCLL